VGLPGLAVKVRRHLGPIEPHRHDIVLFVQGIEADADGRDPLDARAREVGEDRAHLVLGDALRTVGEEVVVGEAGAALVAEVAAEQVGEGAQELVSPVSSVAGVEAHHAHDVEGDGTGTLATLAQGL